MTKKFRNKYRVPSTRLQNWDYRRSAAYFITICTHNRKNYFGHISNGKMELSAIGNIAQNMWNEIKNHAMNVELDAFVVMPNHIHCILILNNDDDVETTHALSLPSDKPITMGQKRFQNQGKNSLSSIVGSYKSAISKHANRLKLDFAWQPRFYDHIIRNNNAHKRIQKYIIENPSKWIDDNFYDSKYGFRQHQL